MYKVLNRVGIEIDNYQTLDLAMNAAKHIGSFVTIKGPDFEVCGIFGVDTIKDGKCPDGIAYDWNKKSRIGRVRKR
jgi:hypothetical protein